MDWLPELPYSEALSGATLISLIFSVRYMAKEIRELKEAVTQPRPLPERMAVIENEVAHVKADVAELQRR